MPRENVERFYAQVARALAVLYKDHPREARLNVLDVAGSDADAYEDAKGTIKWLLDNRFISGKLGNNVVAGAQLTPRSWKIVAARNMNIRDGVPLGEAAIEAVDSDNQDDLQRIGELMIGDLI
ncbi:MULTISPECIES: hypothetical protein [unclassified Aurantimonas]|uniref:hypothetical protein n=1 Tax=unclassified Aurantimonas TaxID=2638230 RepID=UPI002E1961C8|nr:MULTISPECIES: hypothetical protein [unclassified Aurantimonas]MEC5289375.1 hypothetical protein [Aurantimonas sp. C2-3-R2]MEC5410455.1 hypothetical protein [Aurantimonas sp. C2-4-R8]